jgi:uncharacterized delta-60 repeat protein
VSDGSNLRLLNAPEASLAGPFTFTGIPAEHTVTRTFFSRHAFTWIGALAFVFAFAATLKGQAVDPTFNTPIFGVTKIALQADGKIVVSGGVLSGVPQAPAYRLNIDGSLDATFVPPSNLYTADAMFVQPDGKIVMGTEAGFGTGGPVRLNQDGSLDTTFSSAYRVGSIDVLALQPDGKILVAARKFSPGSSQQPPAIVRLNSNGALDATFTPPTITTSTGERGNVRGIALQSDGKIIVAGPFSAINGTTRAWIARLNANGTLDGSFSAPNPTLGYPDFVVPVLVQSDGKIVVGNLFGYGARLTATGALDTSFSPSLDYTVTVIFQLPSGKLLLGGNFSNSIARLNLDGSRDLSFNPPGAASGAIDLLVQSDGKIVAKVNYTGATILRIYEGAIITSALRPPVTAGVPFSYTIKATNLPTSFNATGLPGGLTVNTTTGVISGTTAQSGTFPVIVSATGTSGTATTTIELVAQKKSQTITFAPVSGAAVGQAVNLVATASSGLSVTFSLTSGNGTITGNSLVLNDNNGVVVTATQAGDGTYVSATANQTILPSVKSQTITPPTLATRNNTDRPFIVSVTSSSVLPVTLEIVSGPATVSGNIVTLAGAAGTVTVRATQPGNSSYLPAPPVTFTFNVIGTASQIYFGTLGATSTDGDFAICYNATTHKGELIGKIGSTGEVFSIEFTTDASGNFSVTAPTTSITNAVSSTTIGHALTISALTSARTFRGTINGSTVSGSIDNLPLSGAIESPNGSTTPFAGYYHTSGLGATAGTVDVVASATGKMYAVAQLSSMATASAGTISASGALFAQPSSAVTLAGQVSADATSISGGLTTNTGAPASFFTGLGSGVSGTQRMANLSARATAGSGANAIFVGFVIRGNAPRTVLLRAVGPTLTGFGVASPVSNPRLQLYRNSNMIAENDDWGNVLSLTQIKSVTTLVGAFALNDGSKDAGVTVTLDPGAYTMQAYDPAAAGTVLAEIYDGSISDPDPSGRLINISTRGWVGDGDDVLIGGFVVKGTGPQRVLVRGIGTGLRQFGIDQTVANPMLRIYQNSAVVVENDDWDATADNATQVDAANTTAGAFPLTHGSKDAALVTTLAPGQYSVVVSANGATAGIGLVEIYELSN